MTSTEFQEIETENTAYLRQGYSMKRHQDDHARKIYLAYRDRGFGHRGAIRKAFGKSRTDIRKYFNPLAGEQYER